LLEFSDLRILGHRSLTSNLADVHIEGKFLADQVEGLVVLVLIIHEVDARTDVATSLELKTQRVSGRFDAVGASVVGTIESAVRRASRTIRAKSLVPSVAGVAVGRARSRVEPTPVAIENNALSFGNTAAGSASRHGESRVLLSGKTASLLSVDGRTECESTKCNGEGGHACRLFQRPGLLALLDDERKQSTACLPLYSSSSMLSLIGMTLPQSPNLAHGHREAFAAPPGPLIALVERSDGQQPFCPA
jgi:hypothetical protein